MRRPLRRDCKGRSEVAELETHGGCICGAVRYRIDGEPEAVSLCHCNSCRRAVGATPVAWVIVLAEKFSIEGESLNSYASSEGVERTFCSECGTSLTFQVNDSPDSIDITLATFDRPERFTPERHIWVEDIVVEEPKDLPRHIRGGYGPLAD